MWPLFLSWRTLPFVDVTVIILLVDPTWTQVDQQVPTILYTSFQYFPMIAMMSDIANFITQVTAAIIISPISYSSSYFLSAVRDYKEGLAIIALMFIYYPFTRLFWDTNLYPVRIVHDLGGSVDQVSRVRLSVDVECGARIEIVGRPPVWMFSALSVECEGVQCDPRVRGQLGGLPRLQLQGPVLQRSQVQPQGCQH